MKMKQYIEENAIMIRKFARKINISESTIYKMMDEEHIPNLITIARIREETKGRVSYDDFLPDNWRILLEEKASKRKSSKSSVRNIRKNSQDNKTNEIKDEN